MKKSDNNSLYKYLFSRFLLTLILVGLSQMAIDLLMRLFLIPYVEDYLGIDKILTGKGLNEISTIFTSCLFAILISSISGSGSILETIANSQRLKWLFGDDFLREIATISKKYDNSVVTIQAIYVVLLLLLLLVLWVLPYVVGAICYSRNVSKKAEELERERVRREREYEENRNLLLSDITHDIKTPLTTVAGFSKALNDGEVPAEQRQEYLNVIYSKSMKISELVSMLFEYIKLDSAGYVLNKTKVEYTEFIRECIAGMYAEFEEKNFEVTLNIPDEEIYVLIDKMQTERVISNLLSNAVKYNPSGTAVTLSLRKENNEVIFDIDDNGIKIDREDAIHLFEPFYRTDKSRSSGQGNGLGLSIAKKIVELHEGKIYLIQYRDPVKHGKVKTFEVRLKYVRN